MEQRETTGFVCARCGNCCRGDGFVRVTTDEARRIADYLQLPLEKFLAGYTRKPEIQEHTQAGDLWLTDRTEPELACIFLEANGCLIQPVKPEHCEGFPLRWRTRDVLTYCEGMRR